jgi:hypothetical protein
MPEPSSVVVTKRTKISFLHVFGNARPVVFHLNHGTATSVDRDAKFDSPVLGGGNHREGPEGVEDQVDEQ